jgi:rSAM/selenodomain-associated transferase 1
MLGLFVKAPRPGQVKTRLAAAVSNHWAAAVAEALLLDTIERLAKITAERSLYFSPPDASPYFEAVAAHRFTLAPQGQGDLGCRMTAYFAEQFRAGAAKVMLVGSDSPTLPIDYIQDGFAMLDSHDVVLGPATDGGYYLVGCARAAPEIFANIPWGSSQVLQDTIGAIARAGCRLALLPPWYDVDTLDDWRMLQGHVAALRQAGLDPGIPHTERLLQEPVP